MDNVPSSSSSTKKSRRRVTFAPGTVSPEPRINWKKVKALVDKLHENVNPVPRIMDQNIRLYIQGTGPVTGQLSRDGDVTIYTVSGRIDHIFQVQTDHMSNLNEPRQSVVKIEVDGQITNCTEGSIENIGPTCPIVIQGQIRRLLKVHHMLPPPSPGSSSEDSGRVSSNSEGSSGDWDHSSDPPPPEANVPRAAGEDPGASGSAPSPPSCSSPLTSERVKEDLEEGLGLLKLVCGLATILFIASLILCSVGFFVVPPRDCGGRSWSEEDDSVNNLDFSVQFFGYKVELTISPNPINSLYNYHYHVGCEKSSELKTAVERWWWGLNYNSTTNQSSLVYV